VPARRYLAKTVDELTWLLTTSVRHQGAVPRRNRISLLPAPLKAPVPAICHSVHLADESGCCNLIVVDRVDHQHLSVVRCHSDVRGARR